jgi:multiple sugar transport system permease protein
VYSIALALTDADLLTPARFIGLGNFRELAEDTIFVEVLWRSALFVAIAVPLRLFIATALALALHARARGVGPARTAGFLPTVVPDAAWAMVWLFLLNPVYGPVNALLGAFGVAPVSWFSDGDAAFAAIVLMMAFTAGEAFIVALAARQELPDELFSVARLEGAGPWYVLRTVTLPLMAPVLGLLAVRDVALSLQATFTATYLLTDGGPDRATLLLPIYSFDMGFELLRYGYASAMMLLAFLACLALGFAQYLVVRRWHLRI